jgi:hypothetical protein
VSPKNFPTQRSRSKPPCPLLILSTLEKRVLNFPSTSPHTKLEKKERRKKHVAKLFILQGY